MKMLFLSLLAAINLMAQAPLEHAPGQRPGPREDRRPKLTQEQQKQRLAIIQKYDANKNGKLDPEERANVSEADRKLLRPPGPKGGKDKPKPKKD